MLSQHYRLCFKGCLLDVAVRVPCRPRLKVAGAVREIIPELRQVGLRHGHSLVTSYKLLVEVPLDTP